MKRLFLNTCVFASLLASAQQQTLEFFKWNDVNHPFRNGFSFYDESLKVSPQNQDSKGNTWEMYAANPPAGFFQITKNTEKINLAVSPKQKAGYTYFQYSSYVTVNEKDTKLITASGSKTVTDPKTSAKITYYDNYLVKYDTSGGLQYLHANQLGDSDSTARWYATYATGNQLLIVKSNGKLAWGTTKLDTFSFASLGIEGSNSMFSDKQSTIYCVAGYYASGFTITSFHSDGTYQRRLVGKSIRNVYFDEKTATLTVYAKEGAYLLQAKTEKQFEIPSYTQLAASSIIKSKTLWLGNYKVEVLLSRRGIYVKEGNNASTYLFAGKQEINADSLGFPDYQLYKSVNLQEDSTLAFAYDFYNTSEGKSFKYLFTYKKGAFTLHKKYDLKALGINDSYNVAFYIGKSHTYLYLGNYNQMYQVKDNDIVTSIPLTDHECRPETVIVATKDYLWFAGENTFEHEGPCAIARFAHDTYFVRGKVYYDANTNGFKDYMENSYTKLSLVAQPSGLRLVPDREGNFAFKGEQGKSYTFVVEDSARFSSIKMTNYGEWAIGVKLKVEKPEVSTSFWLPRARCGTNRQASFFLSNTGVLPVEKVVIKLVPQKMRLLQGNLLVDTAVFTSTALPVAQSTSLNYAIEWPSAEAIGEIATLHTITELYVAGQLASVHKDSIHTIIRCSYDPNDKSVTPVGIGKNKYTLIKNPLEYQIRFENTGNDTAYQVVVLDTLAPQLDVSTFKVLGSSHQMNAEVASNGVAAFHFNNIMLPDSGSGKLAAQGYVRFSIQPKANVANNTLVCNKAAIYFDQNKPVITNTTCNLLVDKIPDVTTGLSGTDHAMANFVYPNPSHDVVFLPKGTYEVVFYTLQGVEVLRSQGEKASLLGLEEGMYVAHAKAKDGHVRSYKISVAK